MTPLPNGEHGSWLGWGTLAMVSIVACIYSVWSFRIFTILPLGDPNRNDAPLSDHTLILVARAPTPRKKSEISRVVLGRS